MNKNFNRVVIDADWILYGAGFAGEKRSIVAIEKQTGNEHHLANRTALWGRKKSKDEGYLAELNKSRETPLTWEDFEIVDVQQPEPLENVLHTAKRMLEGVSKETGVDKRVCFVGEGKSFRHARSTLLEYKGNRTNVLSPIYKDDIKEYLIKYHGAQVVRDLEVDDVVIIEGQQQGTLVSSVDKDSTGFPIFLFNPNHPEWGIMDCRGLGELWWDTTGKTKILRGKGRKFFYKQLLTGDMTDNYKPNAASDVEYGDVSAFQALNECETDLECFKAIKEAYQKMYPQMVRVHGWRGGLTQPVPREHILEVDWKYALDEIWALARMKRSYDDDVTAEQVFSKYGLWSD